jgi:hypothetical protein
LIELWDGQHDGGVTSSITTSMSPSATWANTICLEPKATLRCDCERSSRELRQREEKTGLGIMGFVSRWLVRVWDRCLSGGTILIITMPKGRLDCCMSDGVKAFVVFVCVSLYLHDTVFHSLLRPLSCLIPAFPCHFPSCCVIVNELFFWQAEAGPSPRSLPSPVFSR